ncbi:response regulator [Flavisolibacter tropicus]|uniref:response regulator n=1 Tax=Flavisolibacter tropicus TaxID=1492898 RepID=UPI0009EF231A|nr:response regulator [Flavisolibacter tropicus]
MNDTTMKPSVLLIDDDPDDLFFLTEAFQQVDDNYSYVEAYDGEAALTLLKDMKSRNEQPALIVLDINMPILSGTELLTIFKDNPDYYNIPVVVFTTSSSALDRQYCRQYQVELITKPQSHKGLYAVAKYMLRYCQPGVVPSKAAS